MASLQQRQSHRQVEAVRHTNVHIINLIRVGQFANVMIGLSASSRLFKHTGAILVRVNESNQPGPVCKAAILTEVMPFGEPAASNNGDLDHD